MAATATSKIRPSVSPAGNNNNEKMEERKISYHFQRQGRYGCGLGMVMSIEIAAPPDVVWATISDVANYASFIGMIASTKIRSSGTTENVKRKRTNIPLEVSSSSVGLKEGLSWLEERPAKNQQVQLLKSVTNVQVQPESSYYSASIYTDILGSSNISNASTYSISSIGTDSARSKLVLTMGWIPNRWLGRILILLHGRKRNDMVRLYFQEELTNVAMEAEKRSPY